MTVTLEPALEETAHALGYQSAVDFARIELRSRVAQKVAYFQGRVDLYEQKFGMLFDEFIERIPNWEDSALKRFGIIEKEDDSMEWESSLHSLRFYQQQLDSLSDGISAV